VTEKPVVKIVGLGPGNPKLLPLKNKRLIEHSKNLYFRTFRHPTATPYKKQAKSFDNIYKRTTRPATYYKIADKVCTLAKKLGQLTYCVPGSPFVAEDSVRLILNDETIKVQIYNAPSFLDLIWQKINVDPVSSSLKIVNAESFAQSVAGYKGAILVTQCYSKELLSLIKLSFEELSPERAIVLKNLSLDNELIKELPFSEIDKCITPNHLTSLFIPSVKYPVLGEAAELLNTVAILRKKCPWDQSQTHQSLAFSLIEEAYETYDLIKKINESTDVEHFIEELGDLLLQILMHCQIAQENGQFNLYDVIVTLNEKLIERHPHVFSDLKLKTAQEVLQNWEIIKARSTKYKGSLTTSLPSLLLAQKTIKKIFRKNQNELQKILKVNQSNKIFQDLWKLIIKATEDGLNLEEGLRDQLISFLSLYNKKNTKPEL